MAGNMVSTRRQLILGLPESGKTTFIAALWHVVQSNEVASALRIHKFDGDRTHLNKLQNAWLRCEPVTRTSQQADAIVRMSLEDTATGAVIELSLPDMSGETFREQWAYRQWSKDYDTMVEQADGALLFVHPRSLVEPIRIETVNQLAGVLRGDSVHAPASPGVPSTWDPTKTPTQVQLVELVQFMLWRSPKARLRLGIVVSAWDTVRALKQPPQVWYAKRLPLLDQFVRANHARLSVRYYGVSAQGGTLPQDAGRLLDFTHASERIEVVDNSLQCTSDITVPVQQLAFGVD